MNTVAHDVGTWLPRTKTWLYNAIIALDESWTPWVIANRLENVGEYPIERLFSLRDQIGDLRWVLEMAIRRFGLASHAPGITKYLQSLQPDVLHSHFGTIGARNLRLARKLNTAHVVTFYGFDVTRTPRNPRWRKRYTKMFAEIQQVLCEGPHMAEQIVDLGCNPDIVSVQRLGVALENLPFKERTNSEDPVKFIMAGSFREKKGLTNGLLALAELDKCGGLPDWQLTIIGGPGNNPEGPSIQEELRSIVRTYDLSDRVNFLGFLSHAELIEQGKLHDIFLCPSITATDGDTEGGAPVIMIEMAALGLPIMATNHCDMPYTVSPMNQSYFVPEKNVPELSKAIGNLCDDRASWAEISRLNRQHCETNFDHETQGKLLAEHYDRVTK